MGEWINIIATQIDVYIDHCDIYACRKLASYQWWSYLQDKALALSEWHSEQQFLVLKDPLPQITLVSLWCNHNYRYTYSPTTGAVYGTLTLKYQPIVNLGNIKVGTSSKISLLGYDGDVSWMTYPNTTLGISIPPLPLDTELRWAWVFKFENVLQSIPKE